MKKLSTEAFNRAVTFIKTRARRVDQHLYAHYFEDGSTEAVINAVAGHQNGDGGFGHAMEPDFQLEASSPMATTVAFQYLRAVKAPAEHPVVGKGIQYLVETYDRERKLWESVPPAVNDAPHAPWWSYQDPPGSFQANPCAEICAYLNAYAGLAPRNLLDEVNGLALAHLETQPDAMDMHDMMCYLWLVTEIGEPAGDTILEKLRRGVCQVAELNPEKWSGYCAKPLWLAPAPSSPLAGVIEDGVERNLDYEIEHQAEDGSWLPFWAWDAYPEAWTQAQVEWQGHLTVKTLKSLDDYGRIERG